MTTRGRPPGFRMTDEHRTKIRNSKILNVLIEHVEGQRDMSATQVTAGVALLRKVLPDLSSVEMDANVQTNGYEQWLHDIGAKRAEPSGAEAGEGSPVLCGDVPENPEQGRVH
jgi:hypothetical protein